jgi:hypothetical protein
VLSFLNTPLTYLVASYVLAIIAGAVLGSPAARSKQLFQLFILCIFPVVCTLVWLGYDRGTSIASPLQRTFDYIARSPSPGALLHVFSIFFGTWLVLVSAVLMSLGITLKGKLPDRLRLWAQALAHAGLVLNILIILALSFA